MYDEIDQTIESYDSQCTFDDLNETHNELQLAMETITSLEDFQELTSATDIDAFTQEAFIHMGVDDIYDQYYMSMEGFKWDSIKGAVIKTATAGRKVGDVLGTAIIKGWDLSREYYNRTFVGVNELRKEVNKLKARIDSVKNKEATESNITLRRESVTLSTGFSLPNSVGLIVNNLDQMTTDTEIILTDWTKAVKSLGGEMLKVLDSREENKETLLKEMMSVAGGLSFDDIQKKLKMSGVHLKRMSEIDVYGSNDLPGNYTLYSLRPDLSVAKDDEILKRSKAQRRRIVKFMKTMNGKRLTADSVSISTPDHSDLMDVFNSIDRLLNVLEVYGRSGLAEANDKMGRQMQVRMSKELNLTNNRWVAYNNATYHYISSYTKWANNPSTAMISQSIAVIRAAIMVCNRALAVHK